MIAGAVLSTLIVSVHVLGDVTVGGERPVVVRVPASYDPDVPAPLLLVLHGYGGNGAAIDSYFNFRPLADLHGFLLAHPSGTVDGGGAGFWNATDACCNFDRRAIDDSGYLERVIAETRGLLNVDRDRIYLAGWSNGGFMSYRMSCDHPQTIAAMASLAGATFSGETSCAASSPVHVLQVHGSNDTVILFGGGALSGVTYPGALATVEQWARKNGCSTERSRAEERLDLTAGLPGEETLIDRFETGCEPGGSAELWTIVGGDHGPSFTAAGRTNSFAVSVWDWLLRHPKRPGPEAALTLIPDAGPAPLEVAASDSGSRDPQGQTLVEHRWTFGDGGKAEGAEVRHTYARPGRFFPAVSVITADRRVSPRATGVVTVLCPSGDVAPWLQAAVGAPPYPVSARREGADLVLCGGGRLLAGRLDEFELLHQQVAGDFRFTVRLASLAGGGPLARAGIMVRQSLAADASFAGVFVDTGGTVRFHYRPTSVAAVGSRTGERLPSPSGWLRLERQGRTCRGLSSADGTDWKLVHQVEVDGLPEAAILAIAPIGADTLSDAPFLPVEARLSEPEIVRDPFSLAMRRGDANADGRLNVSDGIAILGFLFLGDFDPPCLDAADVNDSGGAAVDISDATSLFGFLFLGTFSDLPAPGFAACGADGTPDQLGCAGYPPCAP